MQRSLTFSIPHDAGVLCEEVLARGFSTFDRLAEHVRALPYGRTGHDADLLSVLDEKRGTCSSKHRLLAAVAHECNHVEVQLVVGIYEMSEQNTPGVGPVLRSASLSTIPEAHCYLVVAGDRFDFTGLASGCASPFDALLAEYIVSPIDLPEAKGRLHREAITTWSAAVGLSTARAWDIREACIESLSRGRVC